MSQTTMSTNLLQSLEIITELGVDTVGQNLRVLAVDNVLLPVQEPCWDLELCGVLDDRNDPLQLIRVEISGTKFESMRVSLKIKIVVVRTAC